MKERAFVCDPVCALPYGHNVVGLKYFSDALRPLFRSVIPVASVSLGNGIAAKYQFEREFEFYYHQHIELPSSGNYTPKRFQSPTPGSDSVLELATRDIATIFEKFGVTERDAFVFPCVDYYGAMGMLRLLHERRPENAPMVYFRFIGVMENATSTGLPGLPQLIRKIKKMIASGYHIRLCAETPRYADKLAEDLGSVVSVVAYPMHANIIRAPLEVEDDEGAKQRAFTVACPGSARLDKGYLALRDIFGSIRRNDPAQSVRFVMQALPISDALRHTSYTNQLYAIPGVKILSSTISEDEMNALYSRADLVLLPYDAATYGYRGSAVFMESLARGIPVVALAGSAFCDQIRYYGAGSVVSDLGAFVDEILSHRDASRRQAAIRMVQARHRYSVDTDSALTYWISQ